MIVNKTETAVLDVVVVYIISIMFHVQSSQTHTQVNTMSFTNHTQMWCVTEIGQKEPEENEKRRKVRNEKMVCAQIVKLIRHYRWFVMVRYNCDAYIDAARGWQKRQCQT